MSDIERNETYTATDFDVKLIHYHTVGAFNLADANKGISVSIFHPLLDGDPFLKKPRATALDPRGLLTEIINTVIDRLNDAQQQLKLTKEQCKIASIVIIGQHKTDIVITL